MIPKAEIDVFIKKINTKKIELFYCSKAELNYSLFSTVIATSEMAIAGKVEEAFSQLFERIKNEKKISTEIIFVLYSQLLAMNEFYYAGVLNRFSYLYFQKGDYSKVPLLDKPYVDMAKEWSDKRYARDQYCFKSIQNNNYKPIVTALIEGFQFLTNKTAIYRPEEDIQRDVEDYFIFVNTGALRGSNKFKGLFGKLF